MRLLRKHPQRLPAGFLLFYTEVFYRQRSAEFLYNLTKNLTAHLPHNICAVLPKGIFYEQAFGSIALKWLWKLISATDKKTAAIKKGINMIYNLTAPCHFGLEKTLSFELKRAGGENIRATDGRLFFSGDEAVIAKANITSSVAERIGIVLGEFSANTFDEVFDAVKNVPLEQFAGKDDAFPIVKGHSLNSKLTSIPALQRTIKKALVLRMQEKYKTSELPESGALFPIHFLLSKDRLLLTLDTSGDGLHKRGYRAKSNAAPIKETLAAGIIDLARVRDTDSVVDPFCGSGTILIEAAMKALRIAPGMNRNFTAAGWGCFSKSVWDAAFQEARAAVRKNPDFLVRGFDIDGGAVELTKSNAWKAGVDGNVSVQRRSIADFKYPASPVKIITNPPYGERLLEKNETADIYRTMGKVLLPLGENELFVISGNETFETDFGAKAQKNRKLYNGMMMCRLFSFTSGK